LWLHGNLLDVEAWSRETGSHVDLDVITTVCSPDRLNFEVHWRQAGFPENTDRPSPGAIEDLILLQWSIIRSLVGYLAWVTIYRRGWSVYVKESGTPTKLWSERQPTADDARARGAVLVGQIKAGAWRPAVYGTRPGF
jgi:hypothetical protein